MKSLIIFCLSIYVVFAKHEMYDGHSVYKVTTKNIDEVKIVNDLAKQLYLDVWSHALPGKPGQILVSKVQKAIFEETLKAAGVEYSIEVENIKDELELEDQKMAEAASAARRDSNNSTPSIELPRILTYDEVNKYIDYLAQEYPNVVTVDVAGHSFEGRPIKHVRISNSNFQDSSKPIVMLESLIHAREWVTLPVTLHALHKLVVDVTESDLIDNLDWIVVPIVNPDGYIFSHTDDRFWRKNRRVEPTEKCVGVDLNRNFDFQWGTATSSDDICEDIYHGTGPMSEPENQAISYILNRYRGRIALFLDIHSTGSMILYGYGTGGLPPNALTLHLVGVRMAQAIDAVKWFFKPNYIVGNGANILYPTSGAADDYAMSVGVPLSYTMELPAFLGAGFNVFLVNPLFIEQVGFETWQGIKAAARYVIENRQN